MDLVAAARSLLMRFVDADLDTRKQLVIELRPQPDDYAHVFVGEVAALARQTYQHWWTEPELPVADGAIVDITLAYSHELDRASAFPAGYTTISHLLRPGMPWLSWKIERTRFDGLVHLADHWAWFPKPYRALAAQIHPLGHYGD